MMSLLGKIKRIKDVVLEDGAVEKGDDFEKFVVNLFDSRYFSVVEWTSDISRKHDRFVESDTNPDLVMRYSHKNRNEQFCIECKFRSNLYKGKLDWSSPNQLKRYRKYAAERGIPFFVVIGLGGTPSCPEKMVCIPLEEAKYTAIYPSVFEQFERDPNIKFAWRNNKLF